MKHTTLIRPIASLLILGGLLLPALIGCEVGEVPEDATTTTATTTTASTSTDQSVSNEKINLGSFLPALETIAELKLQNNREEHTVITVQDPENISALLSVIEPVNVTTAPTLDLYILGYLFAVSDTAGNSIMFAFDAEHPYVRVIQTNANGAKSAQMYHVAKADVQAIFSTANQLEEALFPQIPSPDPGEFLPNEEDSMTIYHSSQSNVLFPDNRSALVTLLREKLTDTPLTFKPAINNAHYSIAIEKNQLNIYIFFDCDDNLVSISIYAPEGFIDIVYHYTLPAEDIAEITASLDSLL